MRATRHQLTNWRRLLLLRDCRTINPADSPEDQLRGGICVLCGDRVFYRLNQLQAHHIRPKALFPDRELLLTNGVILCAGHHLGIVHGHNAALDSSRTDDFMTGWRVYVPLFDRYVSLARNARFNDENQRRLT